MSSACPPSFRGTAAGRHFTAGTCSRTGWPTLRGYTTIDRALFIGSALRTAQRATHCSPTKLATGFTACQRWCRHHWGLRQYAKLARREPAQSREDSLQHRHPLRNSLRRTLAHPRPFAPQRLQCWCARFNHYTSHGVHNLGHVVAHVRDVHEEQRSLPATCNWLPVGGVHAKTRDEVGRTM